MAASPFRRFAHSSKIPSFVAGCLLLLLARSPSLFAADQLELVDGRQHSGRVLGIDERGGIVGDGLPAGLNISQVRSFHRDSPTADTPPRASLRLDLTEDFVLHARRAEVSGEIVRAVEAGGVEIPVPLTQLRGMVAVGPAEEPYRRALLQPDANQDKILLAAGEELQTLAGLLESLTATEVKFQWQGTSHAVPRERFRGLVLASSGWAKSPRSHRVELAGGSRFAVDQLTLAEGTLRVSLGGRTTEIPWNSVTSLNFRSETWAYLSDLEPGEVEEAPLLTLPQPWRRNSSVGGGALQVGNQLFSHGLGVHARSRLTFEVNRRYDLFVGQVGIHSGLGGKGDCEVQVLGDGRMLWSKRVRGGEPPQTLRIEVGGVRRLTLAVEAGEDLDFGDHVDWCDVRVLRQP